MTDVRRRPKRVRRLALATVWLVAITVASTTATADPVDATRDPSVYRDGPPAVASAPTAAVSADPVLTGLAFPATFAFAPGGRIFYGERLTGRIRVANPSTGTDRTFFQLPDVAAVGEQGLLGLALDPAYPSRRLVYAYFTRTVNGTPQNQIVRLAEVNGVGSGLKTIFRARAAQNHNGGVVHFGPDGLLYLVIGDTNVRAHAQNLSVKPGKVLRMTRRCGIAPGDSSRVYSFGHRNMFGFDFDPETGNLWLTENGPNCDDEINRSVRGGDFGWGESGTCQTSTNIDGPKPRIAPRVSYTPTIAPTGAAFCRACALGSATDGTLLFGAWNDGAIRRLTLTPSRLRVATQAVLYQHPTGVLAVEAAPDGRIHFSDASGIYRLETG